MVAGADTMLVPIVEGANSVTITLDTKSFESADKLERIRLRDHSTGGADYFMHAFKEKLVNQKIWLYGVTEFVFGGMPEWVYVRRESSS
jgi:hypothetical protein